MSGVFVGPMEWDGGFVVMANVTHNFPMKVLGGSKDAACDEITLDFGEPDFHLVEPRRIGGGIMQMNGGMLRQKGVHGFGFVSREVVGDQMNLLFPRLCGDDFLQKGHELRTRVARGGFTQHLATGRVERGIERKGAVPEVFKACLLYTSRCV